MLIKWLGHSAFRLTESTGTAVVTDPYASRDDYALADVTADVVTLSCKNNEKYNARAVGGNPIVIDTLGAADVKGVHILSLKSIFDEDCNSGSKCCNNLIFKYRIDGVDICHMGDISSECSAAIVEAIGTVNVLLIPVGGNNTIDAQQAMIYVEHIMPDIVIPMRYREKGADNDLDRVDSFVRLFDDEYVCEVDGDSIEIERNEFEDYTKLVILSKQGV